MAESFSRKLTLTVVTILLSGLMGTGLTFLFNRLEWRSRSEFEERKASNESRRAEIRRIVVLCQKRYHYSDLIYRLLEEGSVSEALQLHKEYIEVVRQWNLELQLNRLLIAHVFDDKTAELFCDSQILRAQGTSGSSVHTCFFHLGKEVRAAVKVAEKGAAPTNLLAYYDDLQKAGEALTLLYDKLVSYY